MRMTHAETLLPGRFFPKLGLYVANCAHLEREIWIAIIDIEGLNPNQDADEIVKIRKTLGTNGILKRMNKSADRAPAHLQQRIIDIVSHMQRFVDNRHMAIHGAWSADGNNYRVEYFKNFGTRKNPDWRVYTDVVTDDGIDEAIDDCSRLIYEILDIREQIKATGAQQ